MQEEENILLTIGEFAELAGAQRSQLLYYDKHGFFRPAARVETGKQAANRRYRLDQIPQYQMLCFLQRLGCPLSEACSYVNATWADCAACFSLQEKRLQREMQRMQSMRESIALMLRLQSLSKASTPDHPAFSHLEKPRDGLFCAFDPPCLRNTKRFAKEYIRFYQSAKDNPDILPAPIGLVFSTEPGSDGRFPVKGLLMLYRKGAENISANYRIKAGRYLIFHLSGTIGGGAASLMQSRAYLHRHGLRRSSAVIVWDMGVQNVTDSATYSECIAFSVCPVETPPGADPAVPWQE